MPSNNAATSIIIHIQSQCTADHTNARMPRCLLVKKRESHAMPTSRWYYKSAWTERLTRRLISKHQACYFFVYKIATYFTWSLLGHLKVRQIRSTTQTIIFYDETGKKNVSINLYIKKKKSRRTRRGKFSKVFGESPWGF